MIGAIIGDFAGSTFEYDQFKKVSRIKCNELLPEGSFFSDDTILTIAIADAIVNGRDYGEKLKEYGLKYLKYIPVSPYFDEMFSPGFSNWLKGKGEGNSKGDGAMMRVSPIGFLFDSEEDVIKNAYLATVPSHNSEEAISASRTIALVILYARQGLSKNEIIKKLNLKIKKPKLKQFGYTCSRAIGLCLYAAFTADSFEESIKLARSFGGGTDTNACITGAMAEALYGIDNKYRDFVFENLPKEFTDILRKCKVRDLKN